MEEKEKYGIKDKPHNNSSSKEANTLNSIRCLTSSPRQPIRTNIEKAVLYNL
jgi:hypothetical protein